VPGPHRRLAAIMFTDLVGYSSLAQADEAVALATLARHHRLLRPLFPQFGGREVKTVGDAFLVEFDSALDAVRCAIEAQRVLRAENESHPGERKIEIRIGIHVGDVVPSGDDVLGDAVNIASRIQPLAAPGGICLSQQVVDQVENKLDVPFELLPPVPLKGIRTPIAVYRVVLPGGAPRPRASAGSVPTGRQLAVLPLTNISPDPNDGYFADGLTEELISVLSQVHGLSVIARTSVMPYKAAPKPVAVLGSELGVDTILEGSVRKAGNRIRITLQLIDVATQAHVWASSYNRELDDVFAVQEDIAERTAEALRLRLAQGDPVGTRRKLTANLAAYDLYLRGLVAVSESIDTRLEEAFGYFRRATALDPTFAEAYAAWASAYVWAAGDYLSMKEAIPRARELAARALELDPDSSDAHAAIANITFQYDNDWDVAEREFRRAIELNPSNVTAFRFFGMMKFALNQFAEADDLTRQAIRLDPAGGLGAMLSWIQFEAGDTAEGIRQAEAEVAKSPSVANTIYLGLTYLAAGRRDDALRRADVPLADADATARFDHALLNALVGRPEAARALVARIERGEEPSYNSATHLAMMYSAFGEKQKALDLLEQDHREGDRVLWLWYRGIFFDPIRDDPRFHALLRAYGLPTDPPPRLRRRGAPNSKY